MGLDFSLYKKKKGIDPEKFLDDPSTDFDKAELAYGRKSWELVNVLSDSKSIDNGYDILTSDKWESLMRLMDPIGDLLEKISEAYDHYEYYLNHEDDEDKEVIDRGKYIFTEEDRKLIAQYEYWYDRSFGEYPVLGYEFSVGYMKNFYEAKDKVREVLKDPNYEVLM